MNKKVDSRCGHFKLKSKTVVTVPIFKIVASEPVVLVPVFKSGKFI